MSEKDIWAGDRLGRKPEAGMLVRFLIARSEERKHLGQTGSYVLNLNASWGEGKTFFLERLQAQLAASGHLVTYVNGWRDDGAGEPLVAVMAAVEGTLSPFLRKQPKARALWDATKKAGGKALVAVSKGAAKRIIRRFIGDGIEEVVEIFHDASDIKLDVDGAEATDTTEELADTVSTLIDNALTNKIEQLTSRIKSVEQFKSRMGKMLSHLSKDKKSYSPFFILIDELDRCRPTYAIEMLEQVKHLFDIDDLIFIIATDSDQLSKSISAIYGESFDGERYLRRFFHRQYRFKRKDLLSFVGYLFVKYNIDQNKLSAPLNIDPIDFIISGMTTYSLSLRDAEQCIDILRTVMSLWDYKSDIELAAMMPLIFEYQQGNVRDITSTTTAFMDKLSRWTIPYSYTEGYREVISKSTSVNNIFSIYQSLIDTPLPQIMEVTRGNEDRPKNWILQRFVDEFMKNHGGSYNSGSPPKSIMNKYGEIIQNVARFTLDDAEAD